MALGIGDKLELNSALGSHPDLKTFLEKISSGEQLSSEHKDVLLEALHTTWKNDPSILAKMNTDIQDTATAKKIETAIIRNPSGFVNALPQYKGGDVDTFLASMPATPANQPTAPSAPKPPLTAEEKRAVLEKLSTLSNKDIAKLDRTVTLGIVEGLAESAQGRFGVNPAATKGFVDAIKGDPNLADRITRNFQRNPNFIRELAKAGLDNTSPREPFLTPAKAAMTNLMANPQKLANDVYVKDLEARMKMAASMKDGNYKQLFSGMGGGFSRIAEQVERMFSGFRGQPVLSMGHSSSFLPNVMFSLDAFRSNMAANTAFSRYSPDDMVAFPITGKDGKFFHQVPVLDANKRPVPGADGKPLVNEVPNTMKIATASGKAVDIIPSQGDLMAKQRAGTFVNGQFVPGTYEVVVVTGIDENGRSAKVDRVDMTPEQFAAYKKQMEALSKKPYPEEPYTEATHAQAQQERKAMAENTSVGIVRIDPKTGYVVPVPATSAPVQPPMTLGHVGGPDDSANGPAYKKQA